VNFSSSSFRAREARWARGTEGIQADPWEEQENGTRQLFSFFFFFFFSFFYKKNNFYSINIFFSNNKHIFGFLPIKSHESLSHNLSYHYCARSPSLCLSLARSFLHTHAHAHTLSLSLSLSSSLVDTYTNILKGICLLIYRPRFLHISL